MKVKLHIALVTFLSFCAFATAQADIDDEELQSLRAQLQAFSDRLDRLEQSNLELRQENERLREAGEKTATAVAEVSEKTRAAVESVAASSWTDRIALKGDFRLRNERIDEQFKDTRNRNRVRARAAIIADVNDDFEVGLGFASGGDDPVSTNQTLGGGGSSKDVRLDLAYAKWDGLENGSLVGGKFKNFLYKPGGHGLLWDGDWNPEGVGLAWAKGDYFVNAMGTWLESDSKQETEFSYGAQAGFTRSIGGASITAGIGYYYLGTGGKGSFYGDDDDFFGNSFDPVTNTYLYDYEELELFADVAFELGGQPASVFFDYVQNQDASEFDSGYAFGFKYGKASGRGTWEFGYAYQDLEKDAVFGLLTDSDFGGGGTDGTGHIFKGGVAVARNIKASFTYFVNEVDSNSGNEHDYDRLQLDLALKY